MLAFLKRYRELLLVAFLLLVPLGTYVANAKRGRELSTFDKLCLAVSSPASQAVEWTLASAIGLWDGYVALWKVKEENDLLRTMVAELRAELSERVETERENERLRSLLDYVRGQEGRLVAAPVIGISPTHRRIISVAIGSGEGIRRGMAVVTAEGVVGKVIATYGAVADVQLLIDPGSAIAARVQRSRARLTVKGWAADRLRIANALRSDDIEEGDLVVTSGTDRIFPKGLVLGRIGSLDRKPYGMLLEGEVLPAVDVGALEEVLIVIGPYEETQEPRVEGSEAPLLVLPGAP